MARPNQRSYPYCDHMGFLLRLLAYAVGLSAAAWLLPGIYFFGPTGGGTEELNAKVLPLLGVALILTVVTSVLKPLVKIFTFPIVVLTLGMFLLVINAWMLLVTDAISGKLGLHFQVENFVDAVLGSLFITAASWLVDYTLGDK